MIPLDYITAWRANAPWSQLSQIEQDLRYVFNARSICSLILICVDLVFTYAECFESTFTLSFLVFCATNILLIFQELGIFSGIYWR